MNLGFEKDVTARFPSIAGFFRLTTTQRSGSGETRKRLLEAAEVLFIESGYEAMSLRQITAKAGANLAAVNYHFGSKEALMQELLSQRLDRLNQERLQLLAASEQQSPEGLDPAAVFGMLFIPAFRISHESGGDKSFMRLLGRVYSDRSLFILGFLQEHYRPIFGRFFEAFSRGLPHLPRKELGLRLHFGLKALSGILAGEDPNTLVADLSMGEKIADSTLLARLISLISPILTAPFGSSEQIHVIEQLLLLDKATAVANHQAISVSAEKPEAMTDVMDWIKEGRLAV